MVAPPHNYLYGYLKSLGQAPQSGLKEISRLFHPCLIPKGSHFLAQGEVQKSAGFVIKGLFRYYYVDPKGQEHTKHFVRENDFVISLSAFLTGKPSLFFIQALEDATILKAPASNLKSLVRENTYWKDIF